MIRILLLLIFSTAASSADYYVDTNAANDSGTGSTSSPKKYIQSGLALMSSSGGDTLTIRDGTYTNSLDAMNSFVSGTVGNYNIVKAENDGGVIVDIANNTPSFEIANRSYIQVEGLKVISEGTDQQKGIDASHHIKVFRSSFEGGPGTDNRYTFYISSGSEYILMEDNWFYGSGGRQNLLIYESSKVVIRRAVIRHDHGWSNVGKTDPHGNGSVYNSQDVHIQNMIVIDSEEDTDNTGSEWTGAFTLANNATGSDNTRNYFTGVIALNVEGNGFDHGGYGQITNINFQDVVVWWAKGGSNPSGGAVSHANSGTKSTTMNNMTIGNQSYAAAIWGGTSSTVDITNSIIYNTDFASSAGSGNTVTTQYNNCFNVGSTACDTTGRTTTDPLLNGLDYLPRIEAGDALETAGQSGGKVGATITNRIGVSGTLWGEVGYDTVTADPLWPYPNQARIHADLSTARNLKASSPTKRGFTVDGENLTDYIWEALGGTTPADIGGSQELPAPTGLSITGQGAAVGGAVEGPAVLNWTIPAITEGAITGFNVSVQCNARAEAIYQVGSLISTFETPETQVGNCTYKLQTTGTPANSQWSADSSMIITIPAPTIIGVF